MNEQEFKELAIFEEVVYLIDRLGNTYAFGDTLVIGELEFYISAINPRSYGLDVVLQYDYKYDIVLTIRTEDIVAVGRGTAKT